MKKRDTGIKCFPTQSHLETPFGDAFRVSHKWPHVILDISIVNDGSGRRDVKDWHTIFDITQDEVPKTPWIITPRSILRLLTDDKPMTGVICPRAWSNCGGIGWH